MGAIAYELNLDIFRIVAGEAFVQSSLGDVVFIRLSRGCGDVSGKVVRLKLSLYGLKQGSRSWHNLFPSHMKSVVFEQSLTDACGMLFVESGNVSIVTVVHVDDLCSRAEG